MENCMIMFKKEKIIKSYSFNWWLNLIKQGMLSHLIRDEVAFIFFMKTAYFSIFSKLRNYLSDRNGEEPVLLNHFSGNSDNLSFIFFP